MVGTEMHTPTYILILIVLSLAWLGLLREPEVDDLALNATIEQKQSLDPQPGPSEISGPRPAAGSKVATSAFAGNEGKEKINPDSFTSDLP